MSLFGQLDTIYLANPSFEGVPLKGFKAFDHLKGWMDYGQFQFPNESSPDVHPNENWGVTSKPYDGKTYLGLVVRDNETWEAVYQDLSQPLKKGVVYTLELYMSKSEQYMSPTRKSPDAAVNFETPTTLRILGTNMLVAETEELAKSKSVDHTQWKRYVFEFTPQMDVSRLILEAFYKLPALKAYNGHILIDHMGPIIQIKK